jgi:uroporphyrinogen-III synthase
VQVSVVPEAYIAEALAGSLGDLTGQRVLLPESEIARPVLPQLLRAAGAQVDEVTAYVNIPGSGGEDAPRLINTGEAAAIIFSSGSTVTNFLDRFTREGGDRAALDRVCVACIGPQTAHVAVTQGLRVDVLPVLYTLDALVTALDAHFAKSAEL